MAPLDESVSQARSPLNSDDDGEKEDAVVSVRRRVAWRRAWQCIYYCGGARARAGDGSWLLQRWEPNATRVLVSVRLGVGPSGH
ncbi:hypothetical protein V6Z11_D06G108100 [Gossypium hirsutum]